MFLLSLLGAAQCVFIVRCNPIPIPTLLMPEEYIHVEIFLNGGALWAKVDGRYPFFNLEYETVRMDYPLPPNAINISVKEDEESLNWTYNNKVYSTVLGYWGMINWTVSSLTSWENFTVKTHYEYAIPMINGNYTFLYAMGTGRYLDTYAKVTTAYITISMNTNYTDLHVYTVGFENETWTWNTANYTIIASNIDVISLEVASQPFNPLVEDLSITFIPELSAIAILPLVTITTPLAAAMYRRKRAKFASLVDQDKQRIGP